MEEEISMYTDWINYLYQIMYTRSAATDVHVVNLLNKILRNNAVEFNTIHV